ncbi:MAG TPA: MaoC/PaaZ C-terminal domain-containing protein [Propionicimonas sp.]|nr:MaoC/PaaZ C-terminal domain-containing protein [Propionicimonas sp.]HRA07543.1 MaoC/PaaZ C-terminal domain-containing protein [Propionicimonas sp.]
MTGIEAVAAGQELPAITRTFTRADLVRYAGASGDFNPIHWSNQAAAALGLPDVIVHGMLTMGTALRVVTDWAGDPGRVLSYYVRFTKPVVVPEAGGTDVRFAGRVTKVEDGVATVSIEAIAGEVAVLGSAVAEVSVA